MCSPGTECISDTCELAQHLWSECAEVGVYVVDCAAIDPDRGESRAYSAARVKSLRTWPASKKNPTASISALNTAIEVVPLVDPANRCRRKLGGLELWVERGDLLQQSKDSEQLCRWRSALDNP